MDVRSHARSCDNRSRSAATMFCTICCVIGAVVRSSGGCFGGAFAGGRIRPSGGAIENGGLPGGAFAGGGGFAGGRGRPTGGADCAVRLWSSRIARVKLP